MRTPNKPTKLAVKWEGALDADPHALLKAVALVFRLPVTLSTDPDLTVPDKTLMCERQR